MISFREMNPDDADEVATIEEKSFPVPWSRKDFWAEANNKNTFYFVALADEKIVGYIGAWISFGEGSITNVAVDPDYRRRGIGEMMIREFLSEIKKLHGVTAATLEVRPSNIHAIHLYEKLGFKSVGVRRKYYSDNNEDAIIMWNTNI